MKTDLTGRMAKELGCPDAEDAFERLLAILADAGLGQQGQDNCPPWLSLEVGTRQLTLYVTKSEGVVDIDRSYVEPLLRVALQRLVDSESFKRTQERLEMLSAASFEGIMVHVDGSVIDVNQRLCELLGYEPHELLGPKTMQMCAAPEDLPGVVKRLSERFEGEYVITGIRKDGSRFRAELLTKQGTFGERPVRVAAVRDVTERERTQELLKESETRFRDLAEKAFDIVVISRDGKIIDIAGSIEGIPKRSPEELAGTDLSSFVVPGHRPLANETFSKNHLHSYELELLSPEGERIPVQITPVMSSMEGSPVRVAGVKDLRPSRRLEEERIQLRTQMERSQRLESLGVLAGGIAHDFNNLLVGVIGNAELLLMGSASSDDRALLEDILSAGQKGASLTRQMLAYAGQGVRRQKEPVDIGGLCREIHGLLGATLSKKATVTFDIVPGSVVSADRVTLTQVLMNLLTNASDALDGQPGRILVRSSLVNDPAVEWKSALGTRIAPGKWVMLEISDTGRGMDAATRERVFEPFFTTKAHGHGLGLAACLGIVTAHNGALLLRSEPGKGTTFSLMFPHSAGTPSAVAATPKPDAPAKLGQHILIADDEPLVRQSLRRVLEGQGYVVSEASDGRQALAAATSQAIDVVVLDLTMPEMDGAEVALKIRATKSRVPIVLSSGYWSTSTEMEMGPNGISAFLQKPYSIIELLVTLKKVLAKQ
jgi:two-component system, cell cycle sensor histidine kinase and response regulator CckA